MLSVTSDWNRHPNFACTKMKRGHLPYIISACLPYFHLRNLIIENTTVYRHCLKDNTPGSSTVPAHYTHLSRHPHTAPRAQRRISPAPENSGTAVAENARPLPSRPLSPRNPRTARHPHTRNLRDRGSTGTAPQKHRHAPPPGVTHRSYWAVLNNVLRLLFVFVRVCPCLSSSTSLSPSRLVGRPPTTPGLFPGHLSLRIYI